MRRLTLLALTLLGTACSPEESIGTLREHEQIVTTPGKLDLLLVMDTSHSLAEEQAALIANMPAFVQQLESVPGGLPSLHVGVVTTDLGLGGWTAEQCGEDGDGGRLQHEATIEGCSPPDGAYLSDEIGPDGSTRVRNYSGELGDALACISRSGTEGCGLEQPLAAMKKALDGTVPGNAGFLRPDAFLAVVIVTEEDDCSTGDKLQLENPSPDTWSNVGIFSSFRCTRWGLVCKGGAPDHPGTYQDCEPAPGRAPGANPPPYLDHPDEFVDFLHSIKDPRATYIAIVAGDPSPVTVTSVPTQPPALSLGASCSNPATGQADPAIRLAYFADQFPHSSFTSICEEVLPDLLSQLGTDVRETIADYAEDKRDDPAISYGCSITTEGGGAAGAGGLIVLLLLAVTRLRRRAA